MIYLANSFSLQMLDLEKAQRLEVTPINKEEVLELLSCEFVSAIGHQDTASILTTLLGIHVPMNRISISLGESDILIVAQLIGGRLPEGSATLPDGFEFKFLKVELVR